MTDSMETRALLPCPFCGSAAQITLDQGRRVFGVECRKCTANMTPSWSAGSEEWLGLAWNTRALSAEAEASGYERGVRDERERAARVCDGIAEDWEDRANKEKNAIKQSMKHVVAASHRMNATAIRAGTTDPENDHG